MGFERRVTIAFHVEPGTVTIDRILYGGRDLQRNVADELLELFPRHRALLAGGNLNEHSDLGSRMDVRRHGAVSLDFLAVFGEPSRAVIPIPSDFPPRPPTSGPDAAERQGAETGGTRK